MKDVLLAVLILSSLSVRGIMAQRAPNRAALGLRIGYAELGGDQFSRHTGGLVVDGFVRAHLTSHVSLEGGASLGAHRLRQGCILLFLMPCPGPRSSVITSVYVAPMVRQSIASTALVGYGALQTGFVFGEFQDPGPGMEFGVVLGGALPVYRGISADVSILGSLVHVGTELPRSAYGRRFTVRVGLAYAL